MSDAEWQERNAAHVAAAMQWLRLRLRRLADQRAESSTAAATTPDPSGGRPSTTSAIVATSPVVGAGSPRRRRWWQRDDAPIATLPPTPAAPVSEPAAPTISDADLAAAEEQMLELETGDDPPALAMIAGRLGLTRFERDVLLLGAAVEFAPGIGRLCAAATPDETGPYPTFALALILFDDPAWESLSANRPLRGAGLIELNEAVDLPLVTTPFRADERTVNYLKGLNQPDERLVPYIVPLTAGWPPPPLPPSQDAVAAAISDRLQASRTATTGTPIVRLVGVDAPSRQLVAAAASARSGLQLVRMPLGSLPGATNDLEVICRLWERERALLPLALYLDGSDDHRDAAGSSIGARFCARTFGVRFVDGVDVGTAAGMVTVDVTTPTTGEQRQLWHDALGDEAADAPALLSAEFDLDSITLAAVVENVSSRGTPTVDALWDECLAVTRPDLDNLAERIEPVAGWEDLVLAPEPLELLQLIAGQVRNRAAVYGDWGVAERMNRGLGIGALFAGESGTGKTMAAEVLANELRLNLYRIDLSAVVSKYIGETEKNLRRVFDAAERGGTVLFFDEADALFGKRSEVKDSHDRYANIEINYLLQRMEAYRGLAILATNRRSALDPAFVRRLRFIVEFDFPGAAERRRLWDGAFAPGVQTDDLELDRLARLTLSGGSIANVAMDATFGAAAAGTPVTMPLVLAAIGRELRKQGRPVNDGDLRWHLTEVPA